jgi:hypothetical protein
MRVRRSNTRDGLTHTITKMNDDRFDIGHKTTAQHKQTMGVRSRTFLAAVAAATACSRSASAAVRVVLCVSIKAYDDDKRLMANRSSHATRTSDFETKRQDVPAAAAAD